MPRTKNETVASHFRLRPETLADLDLIAAALSKESGIDHSRADAVRYAARQAAKNILEKTEKSPKSPGHCGDSVL